jgi:hypothetical protein
MSAPTPATAAATITIDNTGGSIFDSTVNGGPCSEISITNRAANTGIILLVNVAGLHAAGEFAGMVPSDIPRHFKTPGTNAITKVTVKTASSTAVIDWAVRAKC